MPIPRHCVWPPLGARDWKVRKGPKRPKVTEEEWLREEKRQRGKSWRGTENRGATGRGVGRERHRERIWSGSKANHLQAGGDGESRTALPQHAHSPVPLPLAGSTCLQEGAGWSGASENVASYSKPAQGAEPQDRPTSCSVQRSVHRRVGHAFTKRTQDNQRRRGTDTHPQTLGTRRSPKVSTPLFLTPYPLVNHPRSRKVLLYF